MRWAAAAVVGVVLCAIGWWLSGGHEGAPLGPGRPVHVIPETVSIGPWLAADVDAARLVSGEEPTAESVSPALEARFWVLMDQLSSAPEASDASSLSRSSLTMTPESVALGELFVEHGKRFRAERDRALAEGLPEPQAVDRAHQLLAGVGDDLLRAWCRGASELGQPVALGTLLVRDPSPFWGEVRVYDALITALRRSIAASWEPLATIAVGIAVKACARQSRDPQALWVAATGSGMPMVVREMYLWFSHLPVERVEPYLLVGLRDSNRDVRFGAMECVRDYGKRGEIDTRFYALELARIALDEPRHATLFLEAVAALGESDPVLSDLVRPGVDRELQKLAAASLVVGTDSETALRWVSAWLADPDLQPAGFAALGILAGPQANALLHRSAAAAQDGPTLAAILEAMAGRGPEFVEDHARAVRDQRVVVAQAGLDGLFLSVVAGHARTPHVASAVTNGLMHAALNAREAEARQRALLGLALHGGPTAVSFLEQQLVGASDAQERGLSGALLVLASAGDPERLASLRGRMAGDSPFVRAGLESFVADLEDAGQRAEWRARVEQETAAARLVGELVEQPATLARDPLAWQRRLGDTVERALAAWGSDGP